MNFGFNRGGRRTATRLTTPPASSLTTGSLSPPEDNDDTLDLSSTEYARMRREMMQLVNDLRSLGAEQVMDLPSVVVIGGQSAGKSSLVEAVSGVNVPRDSGTCTRCPMECTMSSNATTWSCTIKLRFDATSQQQVVPFGPTITRKDDVDIWLRRAQAAILNPNIPPEDFYGKNVQELKGHTNQLKFSQNVVSISIKDPSATDISFVDLPGLIHNEDKEVVELVQQLTESRIGNPNAIILITIPMSDEMENQKSVTLAREADPDGQRTIGILTKPDMLGDGAIDSKRQWVDVIEGRGRKHKLKHGYYCVRLPDDAQRAQRLSRLAFQRIAMDYFNSTSPWSGIADRGRFGIPAFVTNVSVLLANHIKRLIPELKQKVEQLLASNLEEIGTLPKLLVADPQIEVLLRVSAFCEALKGVVSGTNSDKRLAQRNRALYTIFAQYIRGTSPDFRPFDQPEDYVRIEALDAEEHNEVRNENVQIMGVYDVRETIKESIAWELPGYIPYEAKTRLINQFTIMWSAPAEKCLASINDVLDDVIQQLVKVHFGQFTALQNLISILIRPDIEECKDMALVAVKETLKLEDRPIFAQNETDFQDLREKWLARYRRVRHSSEDHLISHFERASDSPISVAGIHRAYRPARETQPSPESQAIFYLAQAGYHGLTVVDLERLSPRDDRFEDELEVMADVRAYFTIACKRIVDHVPLKIHQSLHLALVDKLSVSLLQRLLADANGTGNLADRMRELVAEDPAIEAKRTGLEAMRTRLLEMRRKLASFAP